MADMSKAAPVVAGAIVGFVFGGPAGGIIGTLLGGMLSLGARGSSDKNRTDQGNNSGRSQTKTYASQARDGRDTETDVSSIQGPSVEAILRNIHRLRPEPRKTPSIEDMILGSAETMEPALGRSKGKGSLSVESEYRPLPFLPIKTLKDLHGNHLGHLDIDSNVLDAFGLPTGDKVDLAGNVTGHGPLHGMKLGGDVIRPMMPPPVNPFRFGP